MCVYTHKHICIPIQTHIQWLASVLQSNSQLFTGSSLVHTAKPQEKLTGYLKEGKKKYLAMALCRPAIPAFHAIEERRSREERFKTLSDS